MARFYILKAAKGKGRRLKNTPRRQGALLKQMGSAITLDLVRGIKTFKKTIKPDALLHAWASRDYRSVLHEIPWADLPEHLGDATDALAGVMGAGAEHAVDVMEPDLRPEMRYDMKNPLIAQHVDERVGLLVRGIEEDGRELISTEVARWFNEASSPAQVAERIRGSVGLLPAHARAAEKYRDSLFKKGLSPGRVRELTEAYEERLLTYRLRMIARTETANALVVGRRTTWDTAVAQGIIPRRNVTKTWLYDGNPCEVCQELGKDGGQTVGIDERFKIGHHLYDDPPIHPHCFPAGHEVITAVGVKRIEDVIVGDLVLTHRERFRKVQRTSKREWSGELVRLNVGRATLRSTPEHPYLIPGRGWVQAQHLRDGDSAVEVNAVEVALKEVQDEPTSTGERLELGGVGHSRHTKSLLHPVVIVYIKKQHFSGCIYNLSVDEDESFVCNGIVVHNCECLLNYDASL